MSKYILVLQITFTNLQNTKISFNIDILLIQILIFGWIEFHDLNEEMEMGISNVKVNQILHNFQR